MLFLSSSANGAPPFGPFRSAIRRALTAGHVFDRSVSRTALGGFLHADVGVKGRVSAFGASAALNKKFHVGPFGLDVNAEVEASIFRFAYDLAATPTFGHNDYNIEFGGIDLTDLTDLAGFDLPRLIPYGYDAGYNRETRTFGKTVDLRGGSFGAHIGCMSTICIYNCVNIKLSRWC